MNARPAIRPPRHVPYTAAHSTVLAVRPGRRPVAQRVYHVGTVVLTVRLPLIILN